MTQQLLEKYADFLVNSGVNIQPGQTLIISASLDTAPMARLCAQKAYDAGAREVVINYTDEAFQRLRMQRTAVEVLEDVKPWLLRRVMDYVEGEGGAALLNLRAADPELYAGLDTAKLSRADAAASRLMKPFSDATMANKLQWCVAAVPGPAWNSKVFPSLEPQEAEQQMWQAILSACRISADNDPVVAWDAHVASLNSRCRFLNEHNFDAIHLSSICGTDLMVGLADDTVWTGGGDYTENGVPFLANVPTEEVFAAPHRLRTNGIVKSSMPYVYNGNLIEDITVRFVDGVAVEYSAGRGDDLLRQMLSVDEGAKHIGEIALVPASSPIRQSGILYYNTLFDENAACHMAFGAAYPGSVKGGDSKPREQLLAMGVNDSLIHEDIMIGTSDMDIDGITSSGERVPLMRKGEWAF